MTDAERIAAIKTQTLALIADLTENPKPSYSIDGQTVSWGEYLAQLQRTVEWCNDQLAAESPFEISSQGYTP
jgi:hypothetical protein